MRLYGLHEGINDETLERIELLGKVSNKMGIDFICIDSLTFDHTLVPYLSKNDLLYNFARGSRTLEYLLLNNEVTTFYIKNPLLNTLRSTTDLSLIHDKIGLSAPKTIYHSTKDRRLLKIYLEYLGGFPIILKVVGGTNGIGVIKMESWENLISTIDFLISRNIRFIMREFINSEYGARIIVLKDSIISSAKFSFQENDFRIGPNFSATKYEPISINNDTKVICIEAVKFANLEMAGVDILFDKNENPYLLEINFPTGFNSFRTNSIEVLSKLLNHLVKKSLEC